MVSTAAEIVSAGCTVKNMSAFSAHDISMVVISSIVSADGVITGAGSFMAGLQAVIHLFKVNLGDEYLNQCPMTWITARIICCEWRMTLGALCVFFAANNDSNVNIDGWG